MKSTQSGPVSLRGQAVLVTGGTTGIGRAIAMRLLEDGAKALIFGRHEDELQDAITAMKAIGSGKVFGMVADQSDTEGVKSVFAEVDAQLGGLDILINNAAIHGNSVESTPLQDIRYAIETNVIGLMQCTQMALTRFKAKGRGQVVNIGSMSNVSRGAGGDIYVATKAAINGFSDSLRKQVSEAGVRVVQIEPGLVGSDMTAEEFPPEEQPEMIEEGTMMMAEDIAEAVRFALIQPERCDITLMQLNPHKSQD